MALRPLPSDLKPGVSADRASTSQAAEIAALQTLLHVERQARCAKRESELLYLMANETRKLIPQRQAFVLSWTDAAFRVAAMSSVTTVDREAPFVQWIEALLARRHKAPPDRPNTFDLSDEPATEGDHALLYPFAHMLLFPMVSRHGETLGALLVAREAPWDDESLKVGARLAETYAHAWSAFRGKPLLPPSLKRPASMAGAALLGFVALAITPTRLTALAAFEMVPDRPFVVAASSDGVIESVDVQPNTEVVEGQVLYRTVSTSLRDNLAITERAVAVAEAKWKQYLQGAVSNPQAKRKLAAAQAEYALKQAERDYARDLLDKSTTRAPRAGIVIFNDANDLAGRPVATGQRIMEIADRAQVLARIAVPVEDSIVLKDGAEVQIYLDADPLHAVAAVIAHASHGAVPSEGNGLAYRADARLVADAAIPRLGVRGTAKIYGPRTSLLLYLFRRPLSYLRQHYGV